MKEHNKSKIIFVSSHPIQYQVPIFKRLAKKNKNFFVIFGSSIHKSTKMFDREFKKNITWGKNLQTGFKFISFNKKDNFIYNIYNIYKFLKKNNIKILIISGWNNFFYKSIIVISKILNIKIVIRCENNLHDDKNFKKYFKIFVYFIFFKIFYKFISIGKKNKNMYIRCGINKKKIYDAPYCVDDQFFSKKNIVKSKFLKIKKKYKEHNRKIFLFVGKIIDRKGYKELIQLSNLIKNNPTLYQNSTFLIVGTGNKLEEFKNLIKNKKINNFKFLGFKNQKELVYYYKLSDYLILPSLYETWGLVVNEAMSVGTPCIISNNCGCENDLVISGKNGYIYKSGNTEDLFKIVKRTIIKNSEYKKMRIAVRNSILKFNMNKTVDIILNIK
jgi:glycosyltransferase involved in cell wall biosynthesis